uniref:Uncharacterized protein MANES_01G034700 n=1 Tax=Rhizophora mucronata TaxID=61149 RepID=A0A2P2PNC4_RHIMU
MLSTGLQPHPLFLLPFHKCTISCLARNLSSSDAPTTANPGRLFREKLIYLANLKINTQKALTLNPNLRSTPISALHSVERCLSSIGLNRSAIGRVLDMHPNLLTSDPNLRIYPVLDFLLHEVRLPFSDISKSISRCPRLLVSSVSGQLRPAFLFLQNLGFVGPDAVNCQTTVLLVYNVESTLMGKVNFLLNLGFEYGEVKKMVVRSPGLLTFSVDNNLAPKVQYFLQEMKGDLEELKSFPQYFSFSLERKIKPRHRMLMEYGLKLPLSKMLKVSDGEFSSRLVEMCLRLVE